MPAASVTVDAMIRDLYPSAGQRIKQWVVDLRREQEWERETCPRIEMPEHADNTGVACRNQLALATPWSWLDHDCCSVCNDLQDATRDRPDVAAWRALKAARPAITADRAALSDEIQEDISLRDHPMLALARQR